MLRDPAEERRPNRVGSAAGLLIWAILAAAVTSFVYALGHWWRPPLVSIEGGGIDRLFNAILVIIGTVFILVQAALGFFLVRFADRGVGRASYWHENTRLELAWTLIPAAILVVLTVLGGGLWLQVHGAPPPDAATVQVVAQQFGWNFHYPGADGVLGTIRPGSGSGRNPIGLDRNAQGASDDLVASELHLVVGRPVRLLLTSKDVIHSLYIPDVRFKQDAVPGRVTQVWFTPTETGTYPIACAELCGVGHYLMGSRLVVETQEEYDAWLAARAQ
ncbi:cytochrome c oxidase subunit II [Limnochorda pilosa]|uniref:Cytochrome c oxidase subunit 2 n=1 Tax=Limnochorda pilosa TaxID=1555112 RepID=A0A0K2SFS9_LIMPI|nr:cytochrome c oxidase subunit II [Limnochorda pilosa]BAS25963.1 cytochrome C oxidase subunit II [Limnochorda pilosa]